MALTGPAPTRARRANERWFMSIDDAERQVEARCRHSTEGQPHGALGNLSLKDFAASESP